MEMRTMNQLQVLIQVYKVNDNNLGDMLQGKVFIFTTKCVISYNCKEMLIIQIPIKQPLKFKDEKRLNRFKTIMSIKYDLRFMIYRTILFPIFKKIFF